MAARRSWHVISLGRVNAVVWLVLAVSTVAFRAELRWAAREMPRYLSGDVGAPEERKLYRRARRILESGENLERAKVLLDRSYAIDPRCEAGYWIAEYHVAVGQPEQALEHFTRYLDTDPTKPRAYLEAARIHEEAGRLDAARAMLQRGRDYFAGNVSHFVPFRFDGVREKFNRKAVDTYNEYRENEQILEQALQRLVEGGGVPAVEGVP